MLLGMGLQLLRTAQPDGMLRCRVDGAGARVAILPATCKLGLHSLSPAECGAIVRGSEVHVNCAACAAVPGADPCWRLTISGPSPDRAELDDEPYLDLIPR